MEVSRRRSAQMPDELAGDDYPHGLQIVGIVGFSLETGDEIFIG